jgi:hypothetical protein
VTALRKDSPTNAEYRPKVHPQVIIRLRLSMLGMLLLLLVEGVVVMLVVVVVVEMLRDVRFAPQLCARLLVGS